MRRWLPEVAPRLADGRVSDITIHHLLTHSAGLSYVFMDPPDGPYHRLRISTLPRGRFCSSPALTNVPRALDWAHV